MKRFRMKAYLLFTLILAAYTLPGCGGDAGNGHWDQPSVIPTVSSTAPANNATGVAIGSSLAATFSEEMNSTTITDATFTLMRGATAIAGTVTYSGVTAVFAPTNPLTSNTLYTATITTGAMGLDGNALANNYVWSFTTGLMVDTIAPLVVSTVPLDLATDVATNSSVTVTFSEPMAPATISIATFSVKETLLGTVVAGNVNLVGATATFTPTNLLTANTSYIATVTIGAQDLAGNALAADKVWSFTTSAVLDTIAPLVTSTVPLDLATNVATDSFVTATFSEPMAPATISTATFNVKETLLGTVVAGNVNLVGATATFTPTNLLTANTSYTVTVTNGAQDLASNPLVVPAVSGLPVPNPWTFTTAAAVIPPVVPLAINLGLAESFGIASRAGLTSTGVTVINGDVALSPTATCTDATGGPGSAAQDCLVQPVYATLTGMTVTGSIFWAADPFDSGLTADTVTTDLTAAWNEGMAKVNTQPAIAADELGGKIFVPGVYENANLTLAAGGVATLDAQNDPNAIFIFKTTLGGDLIDSGTLLLPSRIDLTNGAQARNVWFIIGRDATIGSGTTWNGNILANRTATVLDGSTVNGRVLGGAGGAGAITLTGAAAPSVTTINVPQ